MSGSVFLELQSLQVWQKKRKSEAVQGRAPIVSKESALCFCGEEADGKSWRDPKQEAVGSLRKGSPAACDDWVGGV